MPDSFYADIGKKFLFLIGSSDGSMFHENVHFFCENSYDAPCRKLVHNMQFNSTGGCDVDRPGIRFLVSTLTDPSLCPSMPPHERVSILSRLLESYPSLFAADGYGGDEETEIGYESTLSGIFPTYEGLADTNWH